MNSFFVNVHKPAGWTSFDVVKKFRGILRDSTGERKIAVGHLGTLDPFATGVLPIAVGKATKLVQFLQEGEKEYIAEVRLGGISTTCDPEGDIEFDESAVDPGVLRIEELLKSFLGEIDQVPPKFSAIKVNGRRAYDLARKGEDVEMKSRKVFLGSLDIIDYCWPVLRLRVVCGKGFYVRSLARDLGEKLGVGGYLTALERTKVGSFNRDNLVTIPGLEKDIQVGRIAIIDAWQDRCKYPLNDGEWQQLQQGQFVRARQALALGEPTLGVVGGDAVCLLESVVKLPGMIKMATRL